MNKNRTWVIVGSVILGIAVLTIAGALSFFWGRITAVETQAPAPVPTVSKEAPKSAPSSQKVEGQVIQKDAHSYVIKDSAGREFRLRVSQTAKVNQEPKIGDRVIARVDSRPSDVYVKSLAVRSEAPTDAKTPPPADMVEGQVLRTDGQSYVVKDISGQEVSLHIDANTKKDGNLTVGDKILARTDPAVAPGYAVSITKH